jgi:uncharacterized protein YdaU (DUF1376 family)
VNYYPFHIGDFRSGTLHLSDAEELAYRRALDWYYDTEQPIPLETQWVSRRLRVDSQVLETVLKDFFVRTDEGWRNVRCDQEIAAYVKLRDKNKANGAKGGRPAKAKATQINPLGSQSVASGPALATHSEGNQEPRTNNQEPITNTPLTPQGGVVGGEPANDLPADGRLPAAATAASHPMAGAVCLMLKRMGIGIVNPSNAKLNILLNAGVPVGQIEEAARKALKAGKTFSYALSIVEREACEARELGAKLASAPPAAPVAKPAPKSFAQLEREEKARRWSEMTGQAHPDLQGLDDAPRTVIDITPQPPQFELLEAAR